MKRLQICLKEVGKEIDKYHFITIIPPPGFAGQLFKGKENVATIKTGDGLRIAPVLLTIMRLHCRKGQGMEIIGVSIVREFFQV